MTFTTKVHSSFAVGETDSQDAQDPHSSITNPPEHEIDVVCVYTRLVN